LEGVPGLGKTMLVRTLSQAIDCAFSRIQFTPDLMPADIVGTNLIVEDETGRREFQFEQGPIFANLVLADEINRATPKTQSAMLEAMQERSVTVSKVTRRLPEPFFVLATQNPLEMEGTYPLPEAQLDRFFFKLSMPLPEQQPLETILARSTAAEDVKLTRVISGDHLEEMILAVRQSPTAAEVVQRAARIVMATHPQNPSAPESTRRFVLRGASPRGGQAMILAAKVLAIVDGRDQVRPEDLRQVAVPALRHRIALNFEGHAEEAGVDGILADVLDAVK
jgi:MoxR-like ATPase